MLFRSCMLAVASVFFVTACGISKAAPIAPLTEVQTALSNVTKFGIGTIVATTAVISMGMTTVISEPTPACTAVAIDPGDGEVGGSNSRSLGVARCDEQKKQSRLGITRRLCLIPHSAPRWPRWVVGPITPERSSFDPTCKHTLAQKAFLRPKKRNIRAQISTDPGLLKIWPTR